MKNYQPMLGTKVRKVNKNSSSKKLKSGTHWAMLPSPDEPSGPKRFSQDELVPNGDPVPTMLSFEEICSLATIS